jgi:hypothetical protein
MLTEPFQILLLISLTVVTERQSSRKDELN